MSSPKNKVQTSTTAFAALVAVFTFPSFTAEAATVAFETQADLTDNFTLASDNTTAPLVTAGAGIGNPASGGLVNGPSGDDGYNFNTAFNLSVAGNQISMFFKNSGTGPAQTPTSLFLGYSTDAGTTLNTNVVNGQEWFGMRVSAQTGGVNFRLQTRSNNSTVTDQGQDFALTTTNFYKFTVEVVRTATAGVFSLTGKVEDFGTDGTSIPATALKTFTSSVTNTAVYNDTSAFAGFRAPSGGGANNFDNFSVNQVPEPGTIGLLALATVGMVAIRRRR
ncbi:MAG TPA: PEP-CTERM sorting domain-containing protein [Chthoniobacteraceae bacterium]|jgi:hypothetical protein